MLELIAQGTQPDYRWRRQIRPGEPFVLGRSSPSFRVPWDKRVSRNHARLRLVDGRLLVQKQEEASNPIFHNGSNEEKFWVKPGEHFVIGNTTFSLTEDQAQVTLDVPNPISQKSFSPEYLRKLHYRDADQRIDVLSRLPELISSAGNEQDLMNRLVNTLLAGIPSASTIAIVQQHVLPDAASDSHESETKEFEPNDSKPCFESSSLALPESNDCPDPDSADTLPVIEIIHWDRRGNMTGDFQPSEKLIRQAIGTSETVLHVWQSAGNPLVDFTFDFENDWAFVCPMDSDATPQWGIYVTGSNPEGSEAALGSGSGGDDLQGDVKFCESVGSTLKNLLLVKQLERRQASLRSFFSPIVMDALAGSNPDEVLAPRECQVSVLFCDLRGFAKTSESMADELLELLNRVSRSLDVMTGKILKNGGVIGDFHGDSAMGFWGWPLTQEDAAARAVAAAREIKAEFDSQHRPDFQIGIGIATGMAVAGKIGTRDQVKVTVFGPVVNLASRLEGMNRILNSSVLIDGSTRDQLQRHSGPESDVVTRPLGKFRPFGMTAEVDVFQLFHDGNNEGETKSAEVLAAALAMFQNGDWNEAIKQFKRLPPTDNTRQFFIDFMQSHPSTDNLSGIAPPDGWYGTVEMKSK